MDLTEMDCYDVNWVELAQDSIHWQAFGNTVMNGGS